MHGVGEPAPVVRVDGSLASGALVLCDHASNHIPAELEGLGLPQAELERHIAYDIGAEAVSRALARALGCPALLTRFSRLVIDPNRGLDDPTLVMRLSDGAIIPGNRHLTEADIAERIARYYAPYDAAIAAALDDAVAAGAPPAVISIHSFTPVWKGWARPWHIGLLWDRDDRISRPLFERLALERSLVVGDNEPYAGALTGDTMDRHAVRRGLPHVLIELRQDLIVRDADAAFWGERLAGWLQPILASLRAESPATDRVARAPL